MQGGAAAGSGKIKPGDQLVSIQGTDAMGLDMDKVLALIMSAPQVRGLTLMMNVASLYMSHCIMIGMAWLFAGFRLPQVLQGSIGRPPEPHGEYYYYYYCPSTPL